MGRRHRLNDGTTSTLEESVIIAHNASLDRSGFSDLLRELAGNTAHIA